MKILYTSSLGTTVDAINDALFFSKPLKKSQKRYAVKWIAGRVDSNGSYATMPAPTKKDFAGGFKLFTDEVVESRAGTSHILGQEACRAMILLGCDNKSARQALEKATSGMLERLQQEKRAGMYCCGTCSCAMWRHLAAGGLDKQQRRLTAAVKTLKAHRDDTGKWQRFPFYYTLLALTEFDFKAAVVEMQYAARTCENLLKRLPKANNKYARRRKAIIEHVLSVC